MLCVWYQMLFIMINGLKPYHIIECAGFVGIDSIPLWDKYLSLVPIIIIGILQKRILIRYIMIPQSILNIRHIIVLQLQGGIVILLRYLKRLFKMKIEKRLSQNMIIIWFHIKLRQNGKLKQWIMIYFIRDINVLIFIQRLGQQQMIVL